MALTSASNWTWNFLLAFFTPFIPSSINFAYGYVFVGCCLAAAITIFFFLPESQGKILEEIDTIYLLEVKPWKFSKWVPPSEEEPVTADKLMLAKGARTFDKKKEAPREGAEHAEGSIPPRVGGENLPEVHILSSQDHLAMLAGTRGASFLGSR